jgi:hypothetical protein
LAIKFMNTMWSLELRNGFGLDVELSNSRPCFIVKGFDDDGEPIMSPAVFQGLALSIPFCLILDWRLL